ncbi:MAG: FAD binding domain-containing protein [Syntrophobacteraceae bacterium]
MILPRFNFFEPTSVQEASAFLRENSQSVKLIAGGTDLLVQLKRRVLSTGNLVSLANIPGLSDITGPADAEVRIGPLATMEDLCRSAIIRENFPTLAQAAGKLGSPPIRNRATLGGNICTARPAGDTHGALIAYGAILQLSSESGMRSVRMDEFLKGPGQTALLPGEILSQIILPVPAPLTFGSFIKFGTRKAMEIALVSATVVLSFSAEDGTCSRARVVLGAVGPTVMRNRDAEALLTGKRIDDALAEEASHMASLTCSPITDIRGSLEYRCMLTEVLTKRAILEILEKAKRTDR